ncbi:DUF348 domain-containing protein [Candidatus Saccharibacteria bacterium]|jgi:uncharacterized protein YabE (DUF348 family)|nr:DUF348 domain-containing protein [Candidatus Saccharibacteria bacterium]
MRIVKRSYTPTLSVAGAVAAIFMFFILMIGFKVSADTRHHSKLEPGQRLVTIFDQGERRTVITEANTVGDTLERAGIGLSTGDIVEPATETEFNTTDYTVNIYRAKPVMIVDGLQREKVISPYTTPKDIAKQAKVKLYDEDTAELTRSEDVLGDGPGTQLLITRATPINLVLYGKKKQVRTQSKTVGEMLQDKQIVLGLEDTLSVEKSARIESGMTIEVWRNGVQTITEEQPVPFTVRKIQDADREVGYREVKTPGKNGKKSVTYEVTMRNGQEIDRKEIQSVEIEKPSEQVEIVGAKPSFSGDFAAALAKLRACEAGGNYANKRNPSYRGAYQFGYATWGNYGGYYDPADAPPEVQDQAARDLYVRRGWQPWPHCGSSLPDTYR